MTLVETMRRNTKWAIAQNPTEITVQRARITDVNGYEEKTEVTVPAQTVRLYISNGKSPYDMRDIQGRAKQDSYRAILADYEADLMATTDVTDTFYYEGERYVIKSILAQRIAGQVVGYQGEVERLR